MELSRTDGFFLGAMVWNYGLIVFGCLPLLVGLYVLGLISGTVLGVLCLAASLILPMVIYPWAWSLWLMTYFLALPQELPGNEVDGHQDGTDAS
jgi:ABC-type glycerol-3-phosphate transport system permease component